MIYGIIGVNTETPLSKFHIYLKEKTGNDGGDLPEKFQNISAMENVNGLYTFAIACVITNTFTKIPKTQFETVDIAILALAQYVKGMATTIPLKKKCVTPLYDHLKSSNLLGSAPSILNLDGDLFSTHYDKESYMNREEADLSEDSFPYWVINTIKTIQESEELIVPKKNVIYAVPYYIQNISQAKVPIYDLPTTDEHHIIGYIPPTGLEVVGSIRMGYGKLMTSKSAFVKLEEKKVIPVKHYEKTDELTDFSSLMELQEEITLPFKVKIKRNVLINAGVGGFGTHYKTEDSYSYKEGDIIEIPELFLDKKYGVIDEDVYIPLDKDLLEFYVPSGKEVREEEKQVELEALDNKVFQIMNAYKKLPYLNVSYYRELYDAEVAKRNIFARIERDTKRNHPVPVTKETIYIFKDESDTVDKYILLLSGSKTEEEAKKIRKWITTCGCKALTVMYRDIF